VAELGPGAGSHEASAYQRAEGEDAGRPPERGRVALDGGLAQQLASRARRRVRGATPTPDADRGRQREVVDAFLAAARGGDFDALLEVLDPDVVLRVDPGALRPGVSREVRGAPAVAEQVQTFARLARFAQPALVNGAAGFVVARRGRPLTVAGFTVAGGRIVEIDLLADPDRLRRLDLTVLAD
jgi:RNA polymerase sigma-70 factor (ECF subfamily)